jgi:hypothetical protein
MSDDVKFTELRLTPEYDRRNHAHTKSSLGSCFGSHSAIFRLLPLQTRGKNDRRLPSHQLLSASHIIKSQHAVFGDSHKRIYKATEKWQKIYFSSSLYCFFIPFECPDAGGKVHQSIIKQ